MFPQRKGGLTFLFKKQFNPANLANQAEVYDAEQRYEREMKMLEQRKKDLAEQEEISRLRREQALATGKTVQERLEWMYEDPLASSRMPLSSSAVETAAHQEQLESYLLGKEYVDPRGSEIKQAQNAVGASFMDTKYDPERDAMRKVQEDPMLLIRKSEQASLRAVLENPMKMRALSEQKMTEYLAKWKKAAKKCCSRHSSHDRHHRHHHHHHHHHRHHHRKDEDNDDNSSDSDSDGDGNEDNSEEKKAAKRKMVKIEDGIARLLEADKTGKARHVLQETEPTLAERMKERVPLPAPPAPAPGKIIADARRQQRLIAAGKIKRERDDAPSSQPRSNNNNNNNGNGLHLPDGPLPKRQKLDAEHTKYGSDSEREEAYDSRRHRKEIQEDLRRKRRMTQEERDRSVAQMKRNGEVRWEQRYAASKQEDDLEKKDREDAARTLRRDEKPEFIEKMQSSAYGKGATLEDRVQRSAPKFQSH